MHRHLIAVEIRIERRADQRVNLDRLTFHQHRLKRLNTQAVQRGGAIQKHGMVLDDFFENIPNHGLRWRSTISLAALMVVQWPACSSRW